MGTPIVKIPAKNSNICYELKEKDEIFVRFRECFFQENVSCLNTVLVFLIFAHRNGKLDEYLTAFQMEEHAHKHSGLLLNNL